MPSPEEKARQKALKQAVQQSERERFCAALPLSPELLRALFDFVDQGLSESECDDTLKQTVLFLSRHKVEAAPVLKWLEECGGSCDCEVLANAEERFLEAFPEDD